MRSLDYYRVFHRIAVEHNVSRASEKLFITQSAVSQSLRNLEETIGARLFDRMPRGMELTAEGRRLFSYIDGAIGLIDAGEREVKQLKSLEIGELFIAAGDTLLKYHLLPYLERLHSQHPGIALRITNRTSTAAVELLKNGRVDLGMVNMPCEADGIEIRAVGEVHDCFVSSDRSYTRKQLSWEELAASPLLLLEQDTITRGNLDRMFESRNLALQPEFELGSVDLLIEFAKIGLGLSHVPKEYVESELSGGVLFEVALSPPLPTRQIGIATRAEARLTPAAKKLYELIIAQSP